MNSFTTKRKINKTRALRTYYTFEKVPTKTEIAGFAFSKIIMKEFYHVISIITCDSLVLSNTIFTCVIFPT